MIEDVLKLAEQGFAVFPCWPKTVTQPGLQHDPHFSSTTRSPASNRERLR